MQLAFKQGSPLFRREAVTVEDLRSGGDCGKRIAQIVYDRSCHLSDRRKPLAPEQLRLSPFERAPHLIERPRQGPQFVTPAGIDFVIVIAATELARPGHQRLDRARDPPGDDEAEYERSRNTSCPEQRQKVGDQAEQSSGISDRTQNNYLTDPLPIKTGKLTRKSQVRVTTDFYFGRSRSLGISDFGSRDGLCHSDFRLRF